MATDKNKIAADCFKKGTEAMSRENWDYAIDMFFRATMLVPDNLLYRQSLRGVERRKYNNNGSGQRMSGMKLMGVRTKIKKCRMQKSWAEVDKTAEEGLMVNPWDASLNADMAEACRQQDYDEAALFGYEMAVANDQENQTYLRAFAELLEERGEYVKAMEQWAKVVKLNPLDGDARSKYTQLQAQQMLDRKGYEEAESTREVRSAYDYDLLERQQSKSGRPAADGPGMSVEADLQRAIRKEPANADNYVKLANYYRKEGQLEQAAETMQQGLEVSGGDVSIREQLEDVQLLQMQHNIDLAREVRAKNPNDEATQQNVQKLRTEMVRREIEILETRVQRYPERLKLKYDLADRYMQFRQYSKAIPLLQQAVKDTRLEGDVLVALGKCFIKENKAPLGRAQLEKAVTKIDFDEKPTVFKEVHYLLGNLCEDAGQRENAEKHYYEVLAVDYEYKDTRERLEKLQAGAE